jgi:hypothetical protein
MSNAPTPGVASWQPHAGGAAPTASTPVGVDVGSTRHLFAAATPSDGVDGAVTVEAHYACQLFAEYQSATQRLGTIPEYVDDRDCLGDIVARYWLRLRTALKQAADQIVDVAQSQSRPVLILEDLPQDPRPLVEASHGDIRWASFAPPVVQSILVDRAAAAGLPIEYVAPEGTSQVCHECGVHGQTVGPSRRMLACTNPQCPVDEACRDRSAAVTVAQRYARGE